MTNLLFGNMDTWAKKSGNELLEVESSKEIIEDFD